MLSFSWELLCECKACEIQLFNIAILSTSDVFLTTCTGFSVRRLDNLDRMFDVGLYLNDLSMHDSSRDLVLAGQQQQAELKMALAQVKTPNVKSCFGKGKGVLNKVSEAMHAALDVMLRKGCEVARINLGSRNHTSWNEPVS